LARGERNRLIAVIVVVVWSAVVYAIATMRGIPW
jgi:hypothetical protein